MEASAIVKAINLIQGVFNLLTSRGIARDRIQAILDEAGDGDVTTAQVQAELDSLASELDDTADLIGGDDSEPA